MIRLNLGCGEEKLENFINIDIRLEVEPDIVWDLEKDGIPFDDNTVDEVRLKDFLEHISWRRVRWFLCEVHRVLKLGGKVFIQCPNFEAIIRRWMEQTEDWKKWPLKSDWEKLSFWIMGGQDYEYNVHKTIFTQSELYKLLEETGFEVEKIESDGGTNLIAIARKKGVSSKG